MSQYYISEVTFKENKVTVVVKDVNDNKFELELTMSAADFVHYANKFK